MTIPTNLNGFYASPVALNTDKKWVVAVVGRDILLADSGAVTHSPVIDNDTAHSLSFFCQRKITLGQWRGRDCEVWDLIPEATDAGGFNLVALRDVLVLADEEMFSLACRAVQLLDWQDTHRFCGRCGKTTQTNDKEHAMICHKCNISNYPRISPCIIALVTRGDHCLLARNVNWPVGRFSALAGFLEAGESAEQALHREVFEEVGLEIDNIGYVGSQSWPFPGQLMLGYIADSASGDINVDGVEIVEAQWFRYDQLPTNIAPPSIMAGRLMQHYVQQATLTYG